MMTSLNGPLTRSQGDALVALVCSMRKDWGAPGVIVGVRAGMARGSAIEVIRASIQAAADPRNETPAIIGMGGPHWNAAVSGHMPTAAAERCPIEFHTGLAHNCPQCRAEQIAVDVDHGQTKRVAAEPAASPEYVRALRAHVERGGDVTAFRWEDDPTPYEWSPTAGLPDERDIDPRERAAGEAS